MRPAAIDDLANPAVGEIRLGFLGSFGSTVMPRLIAGFAEASPRVTFTLDEGAAESIGDLAQSGSIDIGVVSPRPQAPNLAWRSLFRQRLGVAASCDHALAGAAAVSMTDLADEPFVAMRPGFGMRRLLDELCAAAQFRPRIALDSATLTSTAGLVAAGLGISLMPIDGSDHAPRSSVPPLADADTYRDVGMIWNSARPLSRAESLSQRKPILLRDNISGLLRSIYGIDFAPAVPIGPPRIFHRILHRGEPNGQGLEARNGHDQEGVHMPRLVPSPVLVLCRCRHHLRKRSRGDERVCVPVDHPDRILHPDVKHQWQWRRRRFGPEGSRIALGKRNEFTGHRLPRRS